MLLKYLSYLWLAPVTCNRNEAVILSIIVADNLLNKYASDIMSEAQYLRQYLLPKYMLSSSLEELGLSPA